MLVAAQGCISIVELVLKLEGSVGQESQRADPINGVYFIVKFVNILFTGLLGVLDGVRKADPSNVVMVAYFIDHILYALASGIVVYSTFREP
ncbi:hypothetical protein Ddye_012327 [Dipteronia dyeriana]|uniref:Uncharacterized protein n=1 Tax=Dipteronia dyeriana TaxID=168575 RepID=A0AAD9X453_9ROSI|nr:hypothetical protein Ddye_012327 [Dipteronia dyeriana]